MNGNVENQTIANTSGRFYSWRDSNKMDQSKYHWSLETTIVIGWLHWSEIWVFGVSFFHVVFKPILPVFTSHIDEISQTDLIIRTQKKKSEKKVKKTTTKKQIKVAL